MTSSRRSILILFAAYISVLLLFIAAVITANPSGTSAPVLIPGSLGTLVFLAALIPRHLTRQHIWIMVMVFGLLLLALFLMRSTLLG